MQRGKNGNSIIFDGFGRYTETSTQEAIEFCERGIYLPLSPKNVWMSRELLFIYCEELDAFCKRWFNEDMQIRDRYGPISLRKNPTNE